MNDPKKRKTDADKFELPDFPLGDSGYVHLTPNNLRNRPRPRFLTDKDDKDWTWLIDWSKKDDKKK